MILLLAMCVLLLIIPSIILYKLWWIPLRLQSFMESQGIRGPSYRFFHGNTKEIIKMKQQKRDVAMELSHDIFPRVQPHVYSWTKLYGNNVLNWVGAQPEIIVTEPELIKEILGNKEGMFPKKKVNGYFKKLFGDGLVTTQGEKWSKIRKLAHHAFHGECLKEMVPSMIASVEAMLEKWRSREGQEIEVSSEYRILTSEVISRTAFGSSYLEGRKIFEMLAKLIVLISENALKIRFFGSERLIRTKDDREADEMERMMHDSIMEMVKKRQEAESLGNDFLGSLLKAHQETDPKNRISAGDIVDECKSFYVAGQETTYTLLSWATFLLSIHTEWQDKAREEVHQLFGQDNPNSESLSGLETINMVLYETLRLYSPGNIITRTIRSKVKLGKYVIPENVNVLIPSLAVHRNPDIWGKDAHLFKPERFEGGVAQATNGKGLAFLGFGFGPRTCVGLNFAITEAKIALAMILQRYAFTLSPGYVHSPQALLTVQPQHGVQILLHPL